MNPAGGDGDGFDDNSNPLVNKDPNFLLASFYAGKKINAWISLNLTCTLKKS